MKIITLWMIAVVCRIATDVCHAHATQLTSFKGETSRAELPPYEAALKTSALATTLLFVHGQTTERTIVAAERLGLSFGAALRVAQDTHVIMKTA